MKEHGILMSRLMVIATEGDFKTQTRRVISDPSFMGCLTGDCPHNKQTQCDREIQKWADEVCPYGKAGDAMWVKETFRKCFTPTTHSSGVVYRADKFKALGMDEYSDRHKWTPSIFMPRKLSRFTLKITRLRVQKLWDITEQDCIAEGVIKSKLGGKPFYFFQSGPSDLTSETSASHAYRLLWNSINLKPKPVYGRRVDKKVIVSYEAYPFFNRDFDAKYPKVRRAGIYRGLPIVVTENPWVFAITFKKI